MVERSWTSGRLGLWKKRGENRQKSWQRWDGATIFIIRTYLGTKPSIRAAEQIFHPDFETYHRRFAHPSNDVLHKIRKYTNGSPNKIQIPENHICPGCEQGKKRTKSFPQPRLAQVNPLNLSTRISNPSLWNPITSTNMRLYSWMISPPTLGPLTCTLKMLHFQQQNDSSLW